MALSSDEFGFLKDLYNQAKPDEPIEPDDPRFQPWDATAAGDDPVGLLGKHIRFSAAPSIQLFSGFRGSGKTTQLFRLRKELQAEGYIVLYGNALEYVNPAEELSLEMLLIALAGAFNDALKEAKIDIGTDSYWARLKHFITKTEANLQMGAKVRAETPLKALFGGGTADIDIKAELKETPSFRVKLKEFLQSRVKELKDQVDQFVEDGVKAIRGQKANAEVVFLFDSLEQLRGSLSNEKEVYRSVEILFSHHLQALTLPYIHAVYCVPPWLQFAAPNSARISVTIPTMRLWNNDALRSENSPGWQVMRNMLGRRFPSGDLGRFFGQGDAAGHFPLADRLIEKSGGHFRDLLNLFRETIRRAENLPVSEPVVNAAINSVTENFRPIATADARWLRDIGRSRQASLPSTSPEDVTRLTRFLDTHFVVYLKNGEGWYDVHPLIRDEIEKLAGPSPNNS